MTLAKPFLKWAGGKTRVLPRIDPLLPSSIRGAYHEPFLGGGAVFFSLDRDRYECATLSDSNSALVIAYRVVRDSPQILIKALRELECRSQLSPVSHYYDVRGDYNNQSWSHPVEWAAWFIYLNKTCFNGLHRVNNKGKFNTPYGQLRKPVICDEENIINCSAALQGSSISRRDFSESFKTVKSGDFVYCDPPYITPQRDSFTAYQPGGFTLVHAMALSACIKDAQALGAQVLLSGAGNDVTRDAFSGKGRTFYVTNVQRSVGASADTRKDAPEFLVKCEPT